MDDQATDRMNTDLNLNLNLNLNLGPSSPPRPENDPASHSWFLNSEDWIGSRNIRLSTGTRSRRRRNLQSFQIQQDQDPVHVPVPVDTSGEKKDDKKSDEGSFFDCNICFSISRNPVVTCCGHLFCWMCIYQWLGLHSDAQECPVCKGEVTVKTVTPIYGNGHGIDAGNELDDDPTLRIPARPQARRVESLRQTVQRNSFAFPVADERMYSFENRYDWIPEDTHDTLLDSILASRRMRRPSQILQQVDEHVDISTTTDSRWPLLLRRQQQAQRMVAIAQATLNRRQHHEDGDSVSSIVAVIQSGSQITGEIDSTSSSRRRGGEASPRVSDMDSGDSRPPSRRRLTN